MPKFTGGNLFDSLIGTSALLGAVSDYIPFLDDGIDLIIAALLIIFVPLFGPVIWQMVPTKKHKADFERDVNRFKREQEKTIQDIAKERNVSLEKAKAILTAKSRCPKCGDVESYLQPLTISTRAGLGTVHNTYNVCYCKSCNVEFVPRVLY